MFGSRSGTTVGQTNVHRLCRVSESSVSIAFSSSACVLASEDRWADAAWSQCNLPASIEGLLVACEHGGLTLSDC